MQREQGGKEVAQMKNLVNGQPFTWMESSGRVLVGLESSHPHCTCTQEKGSHVQGSVFKTLIQNLSRHQKKHQEKKSDNAPELVNLGRLTGNRKVDSWAGGIPQSALLYLLILN